MKTALMVAEKPSLAQSLAKILSRNQFSSHKISGACSVHEFEGVFPPTRERMKFKFTSVCGHVFSLDFEGKFNNWEKVDPAELFHAPTIKKEATPGHHMPKCLERVARGCSAVVLWLDCDKEGENICFEVLDCVKPFLDVPNPRLASNAIFRAHFSAITDKDIWASFEKLGTPNKNEALSVDARQELDLRIGCAFTRYQTRFFQGKYGNLDSALISYGPCQTPTLGFCVERHDRIQSFKPETYWVIVTEVVHKSDKILTLDWERCRVFDRELAHLFLGFLKAEKFAIVKKVVEKEKTKARPQALNTVEMLRVASSGLGVSPHNAMSIAERLYMQGYISYPRTETTSYSDNFDIKGTLKQQSSHPEWGSDVQLILTQGISHPKKGHDAGDHPPITPMRMATRQELAPDAWQLYEYITKHFIATVSPDCRYLQTTVFFEIGEERLTCTGNQVIDPGYTRLMSWQAMTSDDNFPQCQEGDKYPIKNVSLQEKQTNPPDYLTESELISLMEKHGIGTDASIAVHINNICERNYVKIISGRKLQPTPLGIVLVHGYQKIDIDLVKPTMRAAVEQQLNLIALGRANFNDVLEHALDIFHRKFKFFVNNIAGMDELFEVTFSSLAESGRPLSRCGKCRRYMKYIQAKPSRLHCQICDETYNLPKGGTVKQYNELKCPLDGFELVLWSAGAKGKSFSLCPYCFNKPPFRDMKKGMGCNECLHPTCMHGLLQMGIANCGECDSGVLLLDSSTAPRWRLACNKCNVLYNFHDDIQKVQLADINCEMCDAAFVKATFTLNKSPLTNGLTEYTGCVFCEEILHRLTEMKHARAVSNNPSRNSRGRGRGRRGRGRGYSKPKPKDRLAQLDAYFV